MQRESPRSQNTRIQSEITTYSAAATNHQPSVMSTPTMNNNPSKQTNRTTTRSQKVNNTNTNTFNDSSHQVTLVNSLLSDSIGENHMGLSM